RAARYRATLSPPTPRGPAPPRARGRGGGGGGAAGAAHAEAFGGAGAKKSPSPAAATASGSATAAPPAVPAAPKDALASLAAAERDLADRRAQALVDVPGELARLMASVAAAGAAHAYLLTEAAK
ncbi:hypothetical protein, partial [Streptomyces collinus]|uniref:hypothetical protein n=1 Tax=Streptomyces collinus TaxID=42684 RepID=UPI0036AE7D23